MKMTFCKLAFVSIGIMCIPLTGKCAESQPSSGNTHAQRLQTEIEALVAYAKEKGPLKLAMGVVR